MNREIDKFIQKIINFAKLFYNRFWDPLEAIPNTTYSY